MKSNATLVERLRPLLADRTLAEQLFVIALLESGSADRYRDWAGQAEDAKVAQGLRRCAEREDLIAEIIRKSLGKAVEQPRDLDGLLSTIQSQVADLFGGRDTAEQQQIQAQAERGGEQLWKDLAADESDSKTRALLLECATLEAASAEFLESLRAR